MLLCYKMILFRGDIQKCHNLTKSKFKISDRNFNYISNLKSITQSYDSYHEFVS